MNSWDLKAYTQIRNHLTAPIFFLVFLITLSQVFPDISRNDVLEFIEEETIMIADASSLKEELLAHLYRGDSYLLLGDYERSFEDYNYILNKRIDDESVRQQALDLIRFLYTQAENCCKLSGLDPVKYNWKSCLAPLNAKRWHWKKKWELYGVPPHPSD